MRSTSNKLRIFITCDADPDQATQATAERNALTWEGLSRLPEVVSVLSDRKIPFTLFVRADRQIKALFGHAAAMFAREQALLESTLAHGNEIAWHPHLYEKEGHKFLPVSDPTRACEQLEETYEQMGGAGRNLKSVRIGECWHSNPTMMLLDQMGFSVDSTALPGRSRDDIHRQFDWQTTPNHPYHPSREDYRVADGHPLHILEVPMTTGEIKTSYDEAPVRRYLNLTYSPSLFDAGLDGYLRHEGRGDLFLTLIFHTGEILPLKPNDLHSFGWDTVVRNLDSVQRKAEILGYECVYRTLSEASTLL